LAVQRRENTMVGLRIALGLTAAALVLAGCERPSAVASKASDESRAAASDRFDRSERSERAEAERRDTPVKLVDGKPMWSASRRGSAEENAQRSFERNGEAFGAKDLDDFVKKAHAFIEDPPAGTERLTRANGDVLLYDPKGNVFAVATKDGAPRTLFKPDEGAAYWQEQKTRESRRQTARSDRRENGDS
jgi:pyocin large subunit-like protein